MPTNGTQAVDRAAQLVALVVRSDRAVSFSDLCAESGLARSTTSRLLAALERSALIGRDAAGAWVAGPLFAQHAARRGDDDDLARVSLPVMEQLGELTGETVNLGVVRGGEVVHLACLWRCHRLEHVFDPRRGHRQRDRQRDRRG